MVVQQQVGLSRRARWGIGAAVVSALLALRVVTIHPVPTQPFTSHTKPIILAHQGASGLAPSNTMESYRLGLEQGSNVIDIDIHRTKDGHIVASHDDTIDRMTNGKGLIREMTLEQLRQFDYGYGFTPDEGKSYPYRGKGLTIPTLDEIFTAFPDRFINMEMKQENPPMAQEVWDLARQYHMEAKMMIESFAGDPMQRWHELAGDRVATCANRPQMYLFAAFYLTHLDWLWQPNVNAFCLPTTQQLGPITINLATDRLINRAHKVGVKVYYWTINDEANMGRLLDLGADGIFTDFPDRAAKVLKAKGIRSSAAGRTATGVT